MGPGEYTYPERPHAADPFRLQIFLEVGGHLVKVSVLLASFNGERFLPAQLASLRSQTESDIGILWQDDGSVDGSRSILEDLSREDPRFRPGLEQGRHFGAPGNFFSMLRQTDSDYILFCDQDDVWEPAKISVLLRACQAAEKETGPKTPVLVHSDAALIDENAQFTHVGSP